jgi:Leu/Phe-tRNA-protein transferase
MTKSQGQMRSQRRQQRHQEEQAIEAFIPTYLRRFISPYHGDFCYTRVFHYRLIGQLMSEGFLPIATEGILLPKLHEHRCVVRLPEALHVSKSVRKKSKNFQITINHAFDRVVDGCKQQHGDHCWLYPPLVEAFRTMLNSGKVEAVVMQDGRLPTGRVCPVRLYSFEIWNASTGSLVGGELGYTIGSIYTSLTGFSAQDSAGSVQLAALGRLLCGLGFSLWDLGMEMEYKKSLGSHLMPRKQFLEHVHQVRESRGSLVLPSGKTPVNAKTMIDQTQPQTQLQPVQQETENSTLSPSMPRQLPTAAHSAHQPPFVDEGSTPEKKKQRGISLTADTPRT